MSKTREILIIDSTRSRRNELREFWCRVLSYNVITYGGSQFSRSGVDGTSTSLTKAELQTVQPLACLIHRGDLDWRQQSNVEELLNKCGCVVVFGGTGISAKGDWPDHWFWIPRAIGGTGSATTSEWKQLEAWFSSRASKSPNQIALLSPVKQKHFLIAIYILCQGFLVSERMQDRLPMASAQVQNKEWWAVPLIKCAGADLLPIVTAEWGTELPDSVFQLVKWISGELADEDVELANLVPEVKERIENRLAK
jgi:hypothetical protein